MWPILAPYDAATSRPAAERAAVPSFSGTTSPPVTEPGAPVPRIRPSGAASAGGPAAGTAAAHSTAAMTPTRRRRRLRVPAMVRVPLLDVGPVLPPGSAPAPPPRALHGTATAPRSGGPGPAGPGPPG